MATVNDLFRGRPGTPVHGVLDATLAAQSLRSRYDQDAVDVATDPLRQWQPTLKQKPFIDAVLYPEVFGTWENWFVGSNRIGKTRSGAYCGATLARWGVEPRATAYSTLPDGTTVDVRDRATAGWVFGLD